MLAEEVLGIDRSEPVSIAVIGASGDLALRKIYPALFSLYCQQLLPERFSIVGMARSSFSEAAFRERIMQRLTCRYVPNERCDEYMQDFLGHCVYVSGAYDAVQTYAELDREMRSLGGPWGSNRIYYMAIPPFLFLPVATTMAEAGLTACGEEGGWSHVVIEKPFGSDRSSSDALTKGLAQVFAEDQTYRIDHYLGKAVIQNLMVLRFANLIFDPIWNQNYIRSVEISWMEDLGLEGRAGYFDEYGIIRDVMQNHLLQIMALTAMEEPLSLDAQHIRDEKVKVLRAVSALRLEDVVIGQYSAGTLNGKQHTGYMEEEGVPKDSITPTYAAAVLQINNRRWDGVPFLMRAGKGLDKRMTEIRIRFKEVPGNLFTSSGQSIAPNELIIRVQPDAGISLQIINKAPGLNIALHNSELDLEYAAAFDVHIPDAYECLLLDVIKGDKSLFIRSDELETSWDIFTPMLLALDEERVQPVSYVFGDTGPRKAAELVKAYGVQW